jgi:Flp pilus assembly protein TadB
MMALDRELELAKLQIAAQASLADVQINMSLVSTGIVALLVLVLAVVIQYPATVPPAVAVVLIALGLIILFDIFMFYARRKYERDIRKLNGYIEDFKAGKPLPSLTALCGVKGKK